MIRPMSLAVLVLAATARAAAAQDDVIALERAFGDAALERPLALVQPPGEDRRFYVLEQPGRVLVFEGAEDAAPEVVLDMRDKVDDGPNEAGLLGIAFHPDFQENGEVFLSYTRSGGDGIVSVVSRFAMTADGTIDPASEEVLLTLDQPFGNHNGGHVVFGPDGYLYIGFGDGGAGGDPMNHGQNLGTLFGAILRIDVDEGAPYAIPRDNPFRNTRGAREEIYAYGLRNPWRFSFDRETGTLWAADVGQNRFEEVDIVEAGGNYGWNIREGSAAFRPQGRDATGLIGPVVEYGRDLGCSVTGGFVYRGREMPDLQGVYLFADYCSGRIWGARTEGEGRWTADLLAATELQISSFGEANDGTLYVVDHGGAVYRIAPAR